MTNRLPPSAGFEGAPTSFPETTPRFAQHGHDFTLQAIMEMQRSLGELSSDVKRLSVDMKSTSEKVDILRMRFAWVTGGAAVVGFIFAAVIAAVRLVPASWLGH